MPLKEEVLLKEQRRWGLYLQWILGRGCTTDQRKHYLVEAIDFIVPVDGKLTPTKPSRRYIETKFYRECISCGPAPPPRLFDVFYIRRSTVEWTLKCKELVSFVKELSALECEQLYLILQFHQSGLLFSTSKARRMPESFLNHPEFLRGFKKCFFATGEGEHCLKTRLETPNFLNGIFDLQNPAAVMSLLLSK